MEALQADTHKSTSLLKKMLKERFNLSCTVKSEKYSMGCSLNISYQLGVDQKEIENIVNNLKYGTFDSMTDCAGIQDVDGIIYDGYKLEEFKHVFVRQKLTAELWYRLATMMSDNIKYEGIPDLLSIEQMNESFGTRIGSAWTWNDHIKQHFKTCNFATQDKSKIELKSVHWSEKHNGHVYFIYEVDGKEYNTEIVPVKEIAASKEYVEPLQGLTIKEGEVLIIDYSEKAIAVIGDTKSIKEKLKELGGKFNFRLSCGPGWIFPKTQLNTIQTALNS